MSTRSHFIYNEELGLEFFEETSEPKSKFGEFAGFNSYLCFEMRIIKSFVLKEGSIFLCLKENPLIPQKIKILHDAVIGAEIDNEMLVIHLKGGCKTTENIVKLNFETW
jgi:hypothetical protein